MIVIAIRQKNWAEASEMVHKLAEKKPKSDFVKIIPAIDAAERSVYAEWLLTIFAEIRWREMNEVEI